MTQHGASVDRFPKHCYRVAEDIREAQSLHRLEALVRTNGTSEEHRIVRKHPGLALQGISYNSVARCMPPPLGEIRMDMYGQELTEDEYGRMITPEFLNTLGEWFAPLIRFKTKWSYLNPEAARERAFRGRTDPERCEADDEIVARRRQRDSLSPERWNEDLKTAELKQAALYDVSWRKCEVMEDIHDQWSRDKASSKGMYSPHYPEGAFHSQLRYVDSLIELNKPEYAGLPIGPGYIPSYEFRGTGSVQYEDCSTTLEETAEDLNALMEAQIPPRWHEDLYRHLILFEHTLKTRKPPMRYEGIHQDFFALARLMIEKKRFGEAPVEGCDLRRFFNLLVEHEPAAMQQDLARQRYEELSQDFGHLVGLMETHESQGVYGNVHDDLVLLKYWVSVRSPSGPYAGMYQDVHLLRHIMSRRTPPWLYPDIHVDLDKLRGSRIKLGLSGPPSLADGNVLFQIMMSTVPEKRGWRVKIHLDNLNSRGSSHGLHPAVFTCTKRMHTLIQEHENLADEATATSAAHHPCMLMDRLAASQSPPGWYPTIIHDLECLVRLLAMGDRLQWKITRDGDPAARMVKWTCTTGVYEEFHNDHDRVATHALLRSVLLRLLWEQAAFRDWHQQTHHTEVSPPQTQAAAAGPSDQLSE